VTIPKDFTQVICTSEAPIANAPPLMIARTSSRAGSHVVRLGALALRFVYACAADTPAAVTRTLSYSPCACKLPTSSLYRNNERFDRWPLPSDAGWIHKQALLSNSTHPHLRSHASRLDMQLLARRHMSSTGPLPRAATPCHRLRIANSLVILTAAAQFSSSPSLSFT
jgi:hypothetical protein